MSNQQQRNDGESTSSAELDRRTDLSVTSSEESSDNYTVAIQARDRSDDNTIDAVPSQDSFSETPSDEPNEVQTNAVRSIGNLEPQMPQVVINQQDQRQEHERLWRERRQDIPAPPNYVPERGMCTQITSLILVLALAIWYAGCNMVPAILLLIWLLFYCQQWIHTDYEL